MQRFLLKSDPMTNRRCLLFGLLLLQILSSGRMMAQGNLLLLPRRVIFEGSKRYEELNLANSGKDTARYVISLMHIRMKEDGGFEEISQPDSGENFADRFIRFFPHSVTLGPDESQVIKIQLTKVNELAPGEYRSHLYFRAIPDKAPLGEERRATDSGISIRLIPIFGISIPVIIRVGTSNTQVRLSDLSLQMEEDTVPILNMTFNRTGNMSIYGDISVYYTSSSGKTTPAGTAKGIAVYTPNTARRFRLTLDKKRGIDYHSGRLSVEYSTAEDSHPVRIAGLDLPLR
jgi:P pilus assembly chaperone PapD